MLRILVSLILPLVLAACSVSGEAARATPQSLPYGAWEIGLFAPSYMEVWVESVDVTDLRGVAFERAHGGVPSVSNPSGNSGNPVGWPGRPGVGKTRPMTGIGLPVEVSVRWQSLAEPQTYNVRIDIPAWARSEMVAGHPSVCRFDGKHITAYRYAITLGLAPGGIAKAWLTGACLEPIEIGRFEGAVEPKGPYGGKSGGEYYRPPSEHAQNYLDTHEIPFDSW